MRFRIRYTTDDLAWAHMVHSGRARLLTVLAAAVVAAIPLLLRGLVGLAVAAMVFGGVMALVLIPLLDRLSAALNLRLQPSLREEFEVEVDDRGIRISAPSSREQTSWDSLSGWTEGPHGLLVYVNPRQYRILPWRVVPERERGELRAQLRGHLPEMGAPRRRATPLPEDLPAVEGSLLTLRFEVEPEELDEAARVTADTDRRLFLLMGLAGLGMLGWNGYALASSGWELSRLPPMLVGLFLVSVWPASGVVTGRQYRTIPVFRQERQLDFTPGEVVIRMADQDARLGWERFTGWVEGPRLLRLYLGPRVFHLIPTRVLAGDVRERLLALLAEKVRSAGGGGGRAAGGPTSGP